MSDSLELAIDAAGRAMSAFDRAAQGLNDITPSISILSEARQIAASVLTRRDSDFAKDLSTLTLEIRSIQFPAEVDEFDRVELAARRMADTIDAVRRAALEAGYQGLTDDLGLPSGLPVPRKELGAALDGLLKEIETLRHQVNEIGRLQTSASEHEQDSIVRLLVNKVDSKSRIVRMKTSGVDSVEFSGVAEAVKGLIRTVRDFAATVLDQTSRAAGWLKAATGAIKSRAEAIGTGLTSVIGAAKNWISRRIADSEPRPASAALTPAVEIRLGRESALPVGWSLEALVSYMNDGKPIPLPEFEDVQILSTSGHSLRNIDQLYGFKSLRLLDIRGAEIRDASSISNLANLRILIISGTRIDNLNFLRSMKSLRKLDISNTDVGQLPDLSHMKSLKVLDAHRTNVKSIATIGSLPELQSLNISLTRVEDLDGIQHFASLRDLDLSGSRVTSLDALAGHPSISSLDLAGCRVSDVSVLSTLPKLTAVAGIEPAWKGASSFLGMKKTYSDY